MQKSMVFMMIPLLAGCFFSCSTDSVIVRQLYPITRNGGTAQTNFTTPDTLSESREGITFTLDYIDRQKLFVLGKNNRNTFSADRTLPLLTTFILTIKNDRPEKIKLELKSIVLSDASDTKYKLLNYETFKEMYPGVFDQNSEFSFLFDPSLTSLDTKPIRKKIKKDQKQILFRGGTISSNSTVKSILVFPYIEEASRKLVVTIPSSEMFEKGKPMPGPVKEFRFEFLQTKTRIEEKNR
jgi:hypothetical protein